MLVVACDQTAIVVALPPCSSPTLSDYSATLSRSNCTLYTLAASYLVPTDAEPARLSLALPDPLPARGVWTLCLRSPCGCYFQSVYLERCNAPATPAVHAPLRDLPTPFPVSCAPELQPDLGAANPVLGFEFGRSASGLLTGIDLQADPPYGELLAPAPALTTTAITSDGLEITGTLRPTPSALVGQAWMLLDSYGRDIIGGTLTASADGVGLEADLAEPLGCGTHYLRIGST